MDYTMARIEAMAMQALHQDWVLRLLIAFSIAVLGLWAARWLARALDRLMQRFEVEHTLRSFLRNVAYAVAVVVVLVAALDFAGVPTHSLLAVLGAAGLAIGLALKDSLSNIASGVMLIVLRPFRAGDTVQVAGEEGVIERVGIFQSVLHTAQNHVVYLPNSQITSAPIRNFTERGTRRIDIRIGIRYGDDLPAARSALLCLAKENARVLAQPAAEVVVHALGESGIELQLQAWTCSADHAHARSELTEGARHALSAAGMGVPYPQRNLHVYHHDAEGRPLPQLLAAADSDNAAR